ncbi:O-antigen ligase family protein [Ramlibacter sp.]|uniref:O-antigen ligase family protein n=1 Tax=Ramlibacter sp. TaxID=1917967 RepID=UPI002FCA4B75
MSSSPHARADSGFPPFAADPPSLPDRLFLALPALAVGGYFVLRGWLNALLVVAGIVALVHCVRHPQAVRSLLRQADVRWMLLALASPLVAVLIVAASHQELVPRYFDGPVRMLLAFAVLLYLASRRLDAAPVLALAVPVAVLSCAAMIFLVPASRQYFWDVDRFATYFIDPLFLSQHIMIAGFLCLYSLHAWGRDPLALQWLKLVALGAALAISVGTESRTGWVMAPVLLVLWLVGMRHRGSARSMAGAIAVVALACLAVYLASDTVRIRIDEIGRDIRSYLDGSSRDSSVGLRISLFRANWALFLQHPWTGWGYESLPDLKTVAAVAPFYTPLLDHYFVQSGGHNEFLQAMMRMGVVGLASRLLLFLVPLWIFARAAHSADRGRRINGYFGLVVVIGYLTASASTEVINLIHAASFYALLVAVFAAGAIRRDDP